MFELAFCMPILMLIVTGIYTFGIMFSNYLAMTQAVGIGGQVLSVDRGQSADPCSDAVTAIQNSAYFLNPSHNPAPTYSFVINTTTYPGSSCSGVSLGENTPGTITVTYPCNLTWYGSFFPNCTLTAQVTELIQ